MNFLHQLLLEERIQRNPHHPNGIGMTISALARTGDTGEAVDRERLAVSVFEPRSVYFSTGMVVSPRTVRNRMGGRCGSGAAARYIRSAAPASSSTFAAVARCPPQ